MTFIDGLWTVLLCVLCLAGIGIVLLITLLVWGQIIEEIRELRK